LSDKQGKWLKLAAVLSLERPDGLAMSSRNMLLEHSIRIDAPIIYKTLLRAAELIKTAEITDIKDLVKCTINQTPDLMLSILK